MADRRGDVDDITTLLHLGDAYEAALMHNTLLGSGETRFTLLLAQSSSPSILSSRCIICTAKT